MPHFFIGLVFHLLAQSYVSLSNGEQRALLSKRMENEIFKGIGQIFLFFIISLCSSLIGFCVYVGLDLSKLDFYKNTISGRYRFILPKKIKFC